MHNVFRRIAIHGALTAIALGIIGFMLAELASMWLAGSPGVRAQTGEPIAASDQDGAITARLRSRMPVVMAGLGFAFIAVGELLVHAWRGRRKPPAPPAQPDEAEKLLEEILSQVEASKASPESVPVDTATPAPAPAEPAAPVEAK